MTTLTDLLIERAKEEEIYFKNYLQYARKIKKEVEKSLGKARVFVFGSILRNEPARDIDVLIVSKKLAGPDQKRRIRTKIWKKIGTFSPFEFHLITPEEYQNWYRYFLKEKVEV